MIPVPPRRTDHPTRRSQARRLLARANGYTLWAFNPQPVLQDPPQRRHTTG